MSGLAVRPRLAMVGPVVRDLENWVADDFALFSELGAPWTRQTTRDGD
jgi:hypothetical protein